MAVKRFYEADMHTALGNTRTQWGEDAAILSTRHLKDGVVVSSAVESSTSRPAPDSGFLLGISANAGSTARQACADLASDASPMSRELSSMRALMVVVGQMQIDDQNMFAGEGAFVAGCGFGLANVDLLFGVKAEKKYIGCTGWR